MRHGPMHRASVNVGVASRSLARCREQGILNVAPEGCGLNPTVSLSNSIVTPRTLTFHGAVRFDIWFRNTKPSGEDALVVSPWGSHRREPVAICPDQYVVNVCGCTGGMSRHIYICDDHSDNATVHGRIQQWKKMKETIKSGVTSSIRD